MLDVYGGASASVPVCVGLVRSFELLVGSDTRWFYIQAEAGPQSR